MKKLLIALVLGLLLVAALATVASADNGPHGGFTATTDACASCHRAHSAQYGSNALLKLDSVEALCLSCHDGTGAGTNVEDGVYGTGGPTATEGIVGGSLFGGGFVNAKMATAWSGAATANPAYNATSKATTSHHALGGMSTVWGSGVNNSANGSLSLECTSCHTPHGNGGFTNLTTKSSICNLTLLAANPVSEACTAAAASYRLLKWQPTGSNGFSAPAANVNWSGGAFPMSGTVSGWTVPDNFPTLNTEWYTLGTTGAFAAGDYSAGSAGNVYNVSLTKNYIPSAQGIAYFCAQCHDRYFNNSNLRSATDISVYCGKPTASTDTNAAIPVVNDADGVAPWIHPTDPVRCEPQVNATNVLTGWGDNGPSGDTTYMFRHTSGDLRMSMDTSKAADARTSLGRSCVACHVSHGSTASMTALASSATLVTGVATNNSVLLRMDNRSMCLRCHTDVGFTVAP